MNYCKEVRGRVNRTILTVATLLFASCGGGSGGGDSSGSSGSSSSVNVLTYHNDNARTGQTLHESILTHARVSSASFGKLGFLSTQGRVDAEPLYVSQLQLQGGTHNVVFAATEHDQVYAYDADSFAPLWHVSMLGSGENPSDDHGCGQITPEIGITATPVIDLSKGAHGAIYLVAMSVDSSGAYHQRLHVLDLASGAELFGGPTEIQASYPNLAGQAVFDPGQYAERAALLLQNDTLYLAWTSHCDIDPYTGWIMAYGASSLHQTSVLNITPNGSEGSVWMSGAGLATDSAGNIYLLSANGTFDTTLNGQGFPSKGDFGNAFLKLSTAGSTLAVLDYFTMHDTVSESGADDDFGSSGVLVLPDVTDGSGTTRHLAVGAGKDGNIYLVNRDSMGRFSPNSDAAIYQELTEDATGALGGAVFGMPAYFNGTLYYGAVNDALKAFPLINARLATPSSRSAASFSYPGSTPSISANGSADAIVWAVQNNGGNGILHAYDAADLGHELYSSADTSASFDDGKFVAPMIANGKVYIGTPTGVVVFGSLH
jgi:hypothetical protein